MGIFKRHSTTKEQPVSSNERSPNDVPDMTSEKVGEYPTAENPSKRHILPTWHREGRLHTKGINPEGESGRSGFHPLHFLRVAWHSATPWNKYLNLLWPFVPAAIVLHFVYQSRNEHHVAIFSVNYVAMIPPASLMGFAGQELARKLPRVWGILIETALASVVEVVLFTALVVMDRGTGNLVPVIKAAILGSILANLLLCLGACFLIGGIKRKEQKFHAVVSEVGSGLLLVAGFGLAIPTAFYSALRTSTTANFTIERLNASTHTISRGTSVILMFAFVLFITYSAFSHDSLFDEVLRQDEEMDNDRERDMAKQKFTMTETILALLIAMACVSLIAVFLVLEIEPIVTENGVPDNFMGLILVPLVEKIAEHITAVDEAYDNQINFALYHCLAPSIQTALFNAPLVVFIGWGLYGHNVEENLLSMDLNFDVFMIIVLILAILVVGNFLRDGESNWLEGALLLLVYVIVALTTYYMPNASDLGEGTGGESESSNGEATGHLLDLGRRSVQALMN